ncbi:MAG: Ku protein [Bryobacteraceae bacterium]
MATTVWRGYLTFGLLSIPVRLSRAARAERVSFRRVYRENPTASEPTESGPEVSASKRRRSLLSTSAEEPSRTRRSELGGELQSIVQPSAVRAPADLPDLRPVEQASVRKDTGEAVPAGSVVKGFEYEKNRYLAIEPEELKSIAATTATQMEIRECVRLSEIDPVYFETSYYASPEQAGEKAYALLCEALRATELAALAQFAMHQREHVIVLRPGKKGLIAHTMFYAGEVRAEEEYRADANLVIQKELDLAQTLVQSLAAPFEVGKYRDTYRERLESIISNKLAGRPIAPEKPQPAAEVVDIGEALRKSLLNLKKPAQAAPARTPEPNAQDAKRANRSARK